MIDGTPIAPVKIDTVAREIVYPNGQVAPYKRIAIPRAVRDIRARRAYQLWRTTREQGYRMPVDCGLADRNAVYLFSTTSLSVPQCTRMGAVMASYVVEVML